MNLEPLSYLTFSLLTAAGISAVLLWQSLIRLQQDRLPLAFSLFLAGITLWLLGYAWELSTLDLGTKILASQVQYLGIAIAPTSWLIYTLNYARLDRWLKPIYRGLLLIEPALVTALAWTNEAHHLIWQQMVLVPISPTLASMRITYGAFFYIHVVYCYGLMVWATTLLLRTLVRSPDLYRSQVITLLICAGAPWLGNIVYLLHQILPTTESTKLLLLDWTPLGFLVTGIGVLWGRWRFRLWDIVPIARDTIIEGMRDGVMVVDRQHRVTDLNPAAQSILGLPTAKVIGQPASQILAPWPLVLNQLLQAPDQHRLITYEQVTEGAIYWYEMSLSPLSNPRHQPLGQLLVWRDVTAQKIIELELARAKDAAETASHAKSRFLATMSHELRTPLNAIIGYSELLQEDDRIKKNVDLREDLETIHTAGGNLLALINNILDFSKVEAGKFSLFLEPVALDLLVMEVTRTIEPLMWKNQNQLQVYYREQIQPMHSDFAKIRQILLNLLGNAAKFTDQGLVTLTVEPLVVVLSGPLDSSAVASEQTHEWVRFQVQDTGIGMTPEQLQKVFQAFVQANAATSRHYGGTGLGLALSQSFCHMLGGVISVESELGTGSTFTMDLPIHCPSDRSLSLP